MYTVMSCSVIFKQAFMHYNERVMQVKINWCRNLINSKNLNIALSAIFKSLKLVV